MITIELTNENAESLKYYLAHSLLVSEECAESDENQCLQTVTIVSNPVAEEAFLYGNEHSKKACDVRNIIIDKIDKGSDI